MDDISKNGSEMQFRDHKMLKVCGPCVVTLFIWTPIFEWFRMDMYHNEMGVYGQNLLITMVSAGYMIGRAYWIS